MAKKCPVKTDNVGINTILPLIKEISNIHNVSEQEVVGILTDCIIKSYTRENQDQQLYVDINIDEKKLVMEIPYEVVSDAHKDDYDDYNQVLESDKRVKEQNLHVGDQLLVPILFDDLPKKVVNLIMQSFKQKISEIDFTKIANEYKDAVGTVILGEVDEFNQRNGDYSIKIADDIFGGLSKKDQNDREKLVLGSRVAFYLENVKAQTRDWPLVLSRRAKELAEYYLQLVTPEIRDGDIKIRAVARIAGFKSKIAVSSTKFASNIGSPAAICVGKEGSRVKEISRYLGGEPVEIINWYANPLEFVINTIGASKIIGICLEELESHNRIILVVKDENLSLIIGRRGMNIRLCSELTGYGLDIKVPEEMTQLGYKYTKVREVLANVEAFMPTPAELLEVKNNLVDIEDSIPDIDEVEASDFGLENDFMEKLCGNETGYYDQDLETNDFEEDYLLDDFKEEIENVKNKK